jgi:hypothetical protein
VKKCLAFLSHNFSVCQLPLPLHFLLFKSVFIRVDSWFNQAMTETSFFHGKVLKWSLPEVQPGPSGNEPVLKRVMLPQGELAQLYDSEAGIRYIAAIELRAGSVRGNHYHKVKKEYVYILTGTVVLVLEDTATRERHACELNRGDLALIEPGIAHSLQVTESGQAVEFSPNRFDPADICRLKLV